jgi:hypothetical protein
LWAENDVFPYCALHIHLNVRLIHFFFNQLATDPFLLHLKRKTWFFYYLKKIKLNYTIYFLTLNEIKKLVYRMTRFVSKSNVSNIFDYLIDGQNQFIEWWENLLEHFRLIVSHINSLPLTSALTLEGSFIFFLPQKRNYLFNLFQLWLIMYTNISFHTKTKFY